MVFRSNPTDSHQHCVVICYRALVGIIPSRSTTCPFRNLFPNFQPGARNWYNLHQRTFALFEGARDLIPSVARTLSSGSAPIEPIVMARSIPQTSHLMKLFQHLRTRVIERGAYIFSRSLEVSKPHGICQS